MPNVNREIRTAVFLAAGRGIRLADRGMEIPKGFLTVSEIPIIVESLEHLASVGIERAVIVTGHLAHFYADLAARSSLTIELVHNPRYAECGTMYSLYQVQAHVDEPFLLLEADLVYEPRCLAELLRSPHDNCLLLAEIRDEADAVYVSTSGTRVADISKRRADHALNVAGQYIGIAKMSRPLFAAMCAQMEAESSTPLHCEYDQQCLCRLASTHEVHSCLVPGLVWAEIDTEDDYRRVLDVIHPRLKLVRRV